MVASMVVSHPVHVLAFCVLFMVHSFQHSAADIGAGAWIREGSIEFAAGAGVSARSVTVLPW